MWSVFLFYCKILWIFLTTIISSPIETLQNWFSSPISKTSQTATHLIAYKSQHILEAWNHNKKLKTYKISLGNNPIGKKQFEGDGKTPEGKYTICHKNPKSKYHLSLKLSYPNNQDITYAKQYNKNSGKDIMIHGLGPAFRWMGKEHYKRNWTLGCLAVTDQEIQDIWDMTKTGTPIIIYP